MSENRRPQGVDSHCRLRFLSSNKKNTRKTANNWSFSKNCSSLHC